MENILGNSPRLNPPTFPNGNKINKMTAQNKLADSLRPQCWRPLF